MTTNEWAIVLFVVGCILLIAELLLPTHGVLGVAGAASIGLGIVACFVINTWLGVAALSGSVAATPLVWLWVITYWPRTRIGRRFVLGPSEAPALEPLAVQIGQSGVAISELRPMGVCEFDGQRIEAMADVGLIAKGTPVKVVSIASRRPTVRAAG